MSAVGSVGKPLSPPAALAPLEIVVYGEPAPGGSKTVAHTKDGRSFVRDSSKRSYPWKAEVTKAAGIAMMGRELIRGPLLVRVNFFLPRPKGHYGVRGLRPSAPAYPTVRPDATKLWRPVEDALQGVVFANDAQVVDQHVRKFYGAPARVEVSIWQL